ncbi:TIGR00730 family Rossman fold protein [Patescibacteria group bacterium]|nr:MAG: TIGR00730 family Rossman fold protein [Patescibacteria group bacterium]
MTEEEKRQKAVQPPEVHRMEGELRVCDPETTDHTKDMEAWRILKIMDELSEGFKTVRKYKLAVTFFGSARSTMTSKVYEDTTRLAHMLSKSGFTVITGGAGGIMEAANKGAHEAKGQSVGFNIKLNTEQEPNRYLTDVTTFNYFFSRKVMLAFASELYIYFPGGFGTLDELFEILTLVQTNKIKRIPIILYGKEFWTPLIDFIENTMLLKYQTIDKDDLNLFRVVDSPEEAYEMALELVKC